MPKNRLDAFGNHYITGSYDEVTMTTGSLSFNKSLSQYLSVPHSTGLDLSSGDFTIELWAYFNDVTTSGIVFNKDGVFSASYPQYSLAVGSGAIAIELGNGNGISPTVTSYAIGSVAVGQWYHIAVVRTGSTIKTFLNGIQGSSTTQGTAMSNGSKPLLIGIQSGFSNYFDGSISNLRILKGTALYTSSFIPPSLPLDPITNTSLLLKSSTLATAITDSSITPATVTNNNNVAFNYQSPFNDQPCGSILFNGSNQYLTIPSNAAFGFGTGDFTIECWINTTTKNVVIFDNRNASNSLPGVFFIQSVTGTIGYYDGTVGSLSGTTDVTTGRWFHLAWSRLGTTFKMFVNGVQEYSGTNSGNFGTSQPAVIGASWVPGTFFPGYMTNFRVIKGTALYTANFTPPTTVLQPITNTSLLLQVANSSAIVTDSSTNAFTVTNNGTATYKQFAPITSVRQRVQSDGSMLVDNVIDEVSLSTGSLQFNGTNHYLTFASGSAFAFGTSDFTVEAWIYNESTPNSQYFIDARNAGQTAYWAFGYGLSGTPGRIGWYPGGGATIEETSISTTTNTWYHVCYTRSSNTGRLFVNGSLVTSAADSTNYNISPTISYIGCRYSTVGFFDGSISNLRVLKGTALYTSNFTPSTVPLEPITNTQLFLKNSTLATAITDSSTNNFTITNNNNVRFNYQSPFNKVNTTFGSIYFNGSSKLSVSTSTAFGFGTADFTVELWVNCKFNSAIQEFIDARSVDNAQPWVLGIDGTGLARTYDGTTLRTGGQLTQNTWNHIAWVRASNVNTIYVNGVVGHTWTASQDFGSTKPLSIGNNIGPTNEPLTGFMTNIRIVKGTAVYTGAFTPPTITTPLLNISNTSLLLVIANSANFLTDSSTNAFTVTNSGSVSAAFAPADNTPCGSILFNGSSQYLTVANNAALYASTSNFTTEAWVFLNAVDSTQRRFFSQQAPGSSTVYWVGVSSTNKFSTEIRGSGGAGDTQIYGTTTPSVATWYHVAFTRSGTNTYLFVNGILEASSTGQNQSIGTSSTGIGAYFNPGGVGSPGEYWNGYITNLRHIVGTALYTANFTPPTTVLQNITNTQLLLQVANQPAATIDSSTNAFTVTNNGTAVYRQFAPLIGSKQRLDYTGTHYVANTYDEMVLNYGSVYFPNSSYAFTATLPSLNSNNFTIETWINQSATSSESPLVKYFQTDIIELRLVNGKLVSFYNNGAGGTITDGPTLANNIWYHVALVRNGTTLTQYVNGVANGTPATISGTSNATAVYIGRNQTAGGTNFNGSMSNLKISNTAIYTGNFTPSTLPLSSNSSTHLLMFNSSNSSNYTLNTSYYSNIVPTMVGTVPFNVQSPSNDQPCGSILFDGTSQNLTWAPGSSVAFGTNDFTVEGWFNHNGGTANSNFLFDFRNSGQGTAPALFVDGATGKLTWYNGTGNLAQDSSTTRLNDVLWHHIAYVRRSSVGYLYVDGVQVASLADSTNYSTAPTISYIGTRFSPGAGERWNGYITNIRIVNGTAVYTGNFTPPTTLLQPITNTSLLLQVKNATNIILDSTGINTITNVNTALYKQFAPLAN